MSGRSEISFNDTVSLSDIFLFQLGRFAFSKKSLQRNINEDRATYRKHGFSYPRTTIRIAGRGYLYLFRRVWVQLKESMQ